MRRSKLILAASALFLASAVTSAAPLAAQGASAVGVGAHALDDRSLAHLRDLGVDRVRTTLYWDQWDSNPTYRREAAAQIDRALDRGVDLLLVVHGQPARFTYRNRQQAFDAYAETMGRLAKRFPRVRAWQLWNEMDLEGFTDLFGSRNDVPMRQRGRIYGQMLAKAYPAIKRANPRARVVTGGIASTIEAGFLQGLLESEAPFDVLAIHTYGFPVLTAVELRGNTARELLDRAGRRSTPMWVTEFGLEEMVVAPGFDRSNRAIDRYHLEAWRDPVLWNERTGRFERMYGHVLTENGDRSYDLVRRNGSLRPAAVWLRDHLR